MGKYKRVVREMQFSTENGWAVNRVRGRDTQHGYEVMYQGQVVGWVSRSQDGWRWHLSWSPGSASRAARFGITRVSQRPYTTWPVAVNQLFRTDVGRCIAGADSPTGLEWHRHYSVTGEPWVPKPAPNA